MVQLNCPAGAGANDVITTDHIVAALQELGLSLRQNFGNGTVTITIAGASSQNSPTELADTPEATSQPQVAVNSLAARERTHGQGFFVTDAPASVAASTPENVSADTSIETSIDMQTNPSTDTRADASTDTRADMRVDTSTNKKTNPSTDDSDNGTGTVAPPTSPVDDTEFVEPETHLCARCAAIIPSSDVTSPGPAPMSMSASSGPTPTMSTVLSNTTRWYAVVIGHAVEVFQGWPTVDPLVKGVSGFRCKQYISYEDALAAFEEARSLGLVAVRN
ncbi:hypothetical protein D9615_010594 [Tricholomella constricta]|uniref:Ribonuclease H1 N-terminal domain-containing protein n=1 Tax=Tricholomella constricta TaxID=117010 RepID=A0A8H5GMV2_9AGAR|nr:hypothetical protein D9615_010594 [Tricholomella constricta]